MKKYSANYFEEKFNILYKRLLEKEGFIDDIKKQRQVLGIPEDGFQNSLELSQYLMNRLSKKEKEMTTSLGFIEQYEMKNGQVDKEEMEKAMKEFDKKFKEDFIPLIVLTTFQMHLEEHNNFFTKDHIITYGKKNEGLFKETKKIFDKFMGLDLLDAHIIMHYVEKYLFLGEKGVNEYIKKKVACPHCRYIGVNHFSPARYNMTGQEEGPFSGKYLFNKGTVSMLSSYFDSVFLIIKPYATKEQTIQYIEDNWNDLKEHIIEKNTFYKQLGVNASKIKKSDTEKNKLIYELYKLPKKELLERYKGDKELTFAGIYKETVISAILENEYDIKMSADAIKKTATRFSKSTKLKREPKDIGDI
jgi:hypothetical protein